MRVTESQPDTKLGPGQIVGTNLSQGNLCAHLVLQYSHSISFDLNAVSVR